MGNIKHKTNVKMKKNSHVGVQRKQKSLFFFSCYIFKGFLLHQRCNASQHDCLFLLASSHGPIISSSQGKSGSSLLLWNEEMKDHGRNSDFKPTDISTYNDVTVIQLRLITISQNRQPSLQMQHISAACWTMTLLFKHELSLVMSSSLGLAALTCYNNYCDQPLLTNGKQLSEGINTCCKITTLFQYQAILFGIKYTTINLQWWRDNSAQCNSYNEWLSWPEDTGGHNKVGSAKYTVKRILKMLCS